MPAAAFARTKIQPPRQRSGLLARARIAAPLAAALRQQRVVLVSAPAGFGKTVALTQQIAALPAGTALAWVGADENDDLLRFASCLVAALEPYDLPWRVLPDALVDAIGTRADGAATLAAELVNALAGTEVERGLVVVDDVHRLADPALFGFLERVIERLPAAWGVVLSGRVDPPLPLARWRGRGELAEWRQDDLRFTAAEVAVLAGGRPDAAALHQRTGGWAAGLGLLLGAAPATATHRVDRFVFDFLASEVLDGMPAALRDFLVRCSVLPELQAARCAAVSGDARAAEWLDEIQRRGLFVSVLDEREPTLRLHDLFRDCLAERLQRDHGAELPALLVRAAADESDPLRRLGFLARAGAWDEAERVLAADAPALLAAGRVPQALRLVGLFPAARRDASALLQQVQALAAWAHWDWLAMGPAAARAATRFAAAGDDGAALHAEVLAAVAQVVVGDPGVGVRLEGLRQRTAAADGAVRALLAVARAWRALDECRLDEVAAPMHEAVTQLEAGAPATLWFQCVPLTAYLGLPGLRPVLQRYVAGAQRLSAGDAAPGLRVLATALEAGLELFAGRPASALALLAAADEECRWLHRPPLQATYLDTFAAFAWALQGDGGRALAAAQRLVDGLDDARSSGRRATWLQHYLHQRLRVAAVLDDADTQREMAARLQAFAAQADRPVFVRQRGAVAARLAVLDGRWRDAAQNFAAALVDEVALDHYGQAGELRARLAHARLMLGERDAAAAALAPALARARAAGETAPLRFAGARALAALAQADWGPRLASDDQALLRTLAQGTPACAPAPADGPLSAREIEVLARIAAGDSNKLIARAFDLSPHTVKRHVANILDKLGAASRGQAAAWYRARV